jgi:hypothetical protein
MSLLQKYNINTDIKYSITIEYEFIEYIDWNIGRNIETSFASIDIPLNMEWESRYFINTITCSDYDEITRVAEEMLSILEKYPVIRIL